jgi:hypothetical protein
MRVNNKDIERSLVQALEISEQFLLDDKRKGSGQWSQCHDEDVNKVGS